MYGYPNGLWDEKHNLPLVRKGITSTHPALDVEMETKYDKKSGIVDMACWPGSSGSPIFLVKVPKILHPSLEDERFVIFLGVLCSGPTSNDKKLQLTTNIESENPDELTTASITLSKTASDTMIHLGYYAKAERIVELIDKHESDQWDFLEEKFLEYCWLRATGRLNISE